MALDPYILSIDQSTSGTKAIIFDHKARFVARSNIEHKQIYPRPGWVEHDPEEIFFNTQEAIREVIKKSGIPAMNIRNISITNQRETVVIWDRETGKPVYNAIVWQCMRGEEICNSLREKGWEPLIRKSTGLIIDPYFSASGLAWILEDQPELKRRAEKGELAAGTMDSWLIWKLTCGRSHFTDHTNACRTLLFNIHMMDWDYEIMDLFGIPAELLPEPMTSDSIFGFTDANGILPEVVPIAGVLGDSHAALFGQRCFSRGMSKVTYGTGSSVMMNIGSEALEAPEGLVTSFGYTLKNETAYVFEGNIHSTGATIKWLADSLKILPEPGDSEKIAESVGSSDGVYFIPAFSGLGAPYWNNSIRACITGITGGTTAAHIVRAGLESIAFQVKDLLDIMAGKAGIPVKALRVDGGPTANRFLMQFQSDMLDTPVQVSNIEEASALGAALAGGLGTGIWSSTEELEALYDSRMTVNPEMSQHTRNHLYKGWNKAVRQQLK